MERFAESGYLEDLNPYLENDDSLNRTDFQENILTAYERSGHLYELPLSFRLKTIVGRSSLIGDKTSWTLDEMIAWTAGFPGGKGVFDSESKSDILRLLKRSFSGQLVNTDYAGDGQESPLNRDLLIKILEFANRYENDDQYVYDNNLAKKIQEGLVLLDTDLYSTGASTAYDSIVGEPVTFIGYPVDGHNGNLIYSRHTFAINSAGSHKDMAWEFLRTLYSEEMQMKLFTEGLYLFEYSLRKDILEVQFQQELDFSNNNSFVYWFRTTNNPGFSHSWYGEKTTAEDLVKLRNAIQNADTIWRSSSAIDQIIEEEAVFYFNGIKPLEEVLDVMENRLSTYVNEMK